MSNAMQDSKALDQSGLLERVSATYRLNSAQDNIMRELCVREFSPWLLSTGVGLELGCSDGYMTEMLSKHLHHLTVVEASGSFLQVARARNLSNVTYHHALFEQCELKEKYDYIFVTWVLTHLMDVPSALARLKSMLRQDGLLFVAVPNVRVLSRQLALNMGLVPDLYSLSTNDLNHGHLRAYDRQRLDHELEAGGFRTIAQGGLMLKPFADFQMDEMYKSGILTRDHVEGLYKLGQQFPDMASAIFSVCKAKL